jgi:hypothetical protein
MNKAGRLALIKAVLTAIPLHQLLVLNPPKKIFRILQKILRVILWVGRSDVNGSNWHVNWQLIAHPIQLGSLGIRNMERTGLALRLRWMWFDRTNDRRAWNGLGLEFKKEERSLFFTSTTMRVGNGATAKFWEDCWIQGLSISEITPALYACIPKRRRKSRTVTNGLQANR